MVEWIGADGKAPAPTPDRWICLMCDRAWARRALEHAGGDLACAIAATEWAGRTSVTPRVKKAGSKPWPGRPRNSGISTPGRRVAKLKAPAAHARGGARSRPGGGRPRDRQGAAGPPPACATNLQRVEATGGRLAGGPGSAP